MVVGLALGVDVGVKVDVDVGVAKSFAVGFDVGFETSAWKSAKTMTYWFLTQMKMMTTVEGSRRNMIRSMRGIRSDQSARELRNDG